MSKKTKQAKIDAELDRIIPAPAQKVELRTDPLTLNEALAIIKRCERLFKSAANTWERGQNRDEDYEKLNAKCDRLRDKAEEILAPLGITCDYPGLYPSFQLTITEWGRTQKVHEYNVQGAVNSAMGEIARRAARVEKARALHMLQRLTEKVVRANAIQHSGGTVEPEDWAELYQLANEATAFIQEGGM